MAVTKETEKMVREHRAKAEEYADRVRAGEEPWRDADGVDPVLPVDGNVGEKGEPDKADKDK